MDKIHKPTGIEINTHPPTHPGDTLKPLAQMASTIKIKFTTQQQKDPLALGYLQTGWLSLQYDEC